MVPFGSVCVINKKGCKLLTKNKLDDLFVYDQFKGTLSSKSTGIILSPSRQVWVDGRRVSASRVIYTMMTGAEPKHNVYFADGDKTNYKWENLSQTPRFKRRTRGNGLAAMGFQLRTNKTGGAVYIARAYVDRPDGTGKHTYIVGRFSSEAEAIQAHQLVTAHNKPYWFTGIRKNADIVDGRVSLITPEIAHQ